MNGAIGPVPFEPTRLAKCPFWKTVTTTPYAAPIDRRFITTAFSGTSSERNTTSRRRKLSDSTAPMNSNRRDENRSETSTPAAVNPPTYTLVAESPSATGITCLRRLWIRETVRRLCGDELGITWITAAAPEGLSCGRLTATTPGVRETSATSCDRTATSPGGDNRAASTSGPLEPAPNPLTRRS